MDIDHNGLDFVNTIEVEVWSVEELIETVTNEKSAA